MRLITENPVGTTTLLRRQSTKARTVQRPQAAGPLAGMMFVYIVVVVGRLADVVPHLSAVPLAKIVAALAILVAIQGRTAMARRPILSYAPAKGALLTMLLIIMSMAFSVLHYATLGVITGTVLSVAVGLILMIKAATNWRAIRTLLLGFFVSAIILAAAVNATQFAGRAGRISSLDPNDFAFVLDGLLPIAVMFAITSRGVKKLGYLAGCIWIVVSILLTQSRGGLLGLVFGTLVMTLILPTKRHGALTRQPSAGTVLIRVLLLLLAGGYIWHSLPNATRTRLATITTVDSDKSMKAASDGRWTIWEDTLPLSLERPWGWGAGAFATVDGMYGGGRWKAPHNTLLQALIELGFLGLGLTLATVWASLRYLVREAWASAISDNEDSLERRGFARALIASLIALCVAGFFLSELYSQMLWAVIILSCVIGRADTKSGAIDARLSDGASNVERPRG